MAEQYVDYWTGDGWGASGQAGTTYRHWNDGHWETQQQGYWVPLPGGARGYSETPFRRIREDEVPERIRQSAQPR